MSSVSAKGHVEYHWRDKRALQTFLKLSDTISLIWKTTAHRARGLPPEEVERLRRDAHQVASPLVRQATKLRAMYAKPDGE